MSSPRLSILPRPGRAIWFALGLLAILGLVWGYFYAQRRITALAYVASTGGKVEFAPPPMWWPKRIPVPNWLRPAVEVEVQGKEPCDLREIAPLSELRHLCLEGTAITDEGLIELEKISTLRYLGLKRTRITNRGLEQVVHLPLRALRIDGVQVSDEQVRQLAKLPLEYLYLTDCGSHRDAIMEFRETKTLKRLILSAPPYSRTDRLRWQAAGIPVQLRPEEPCGVIPL